MNIIKNDGMLSMDETSEELEGFGKIKLGCEQDNKVVDLIDLQLGESDFIFLNSEHQSKFRDIDDLEDIEAVKERDEKKEKLFMCKKCGVHLVEEYYNRHVKWAHKKIDVNFVCFTCNIGFLNFKSYQEHIKYHNKPYACDKCPSRFLYAYSYHAHLAHHIGKIQCEHPGCSQLFDVYEDMIKHFRQHVFIKSSKLTYYCCYCDATYMMPYLLRQHKTKVHNIYTGYSI